MKAMVEANKEKEESAKVVADLILSVKNYFFSSETLVLPVAVLLAIVALSLIHI